EGQDVTELHSFPPVRPKLELHVAALSASTGSHMKLRGICPQISVRRSRTFSRSASVLTATLTAKRMDAGGIDGRSRIAHPRISDGLRRRGRRRTLILRIRNQQVAGSNPAGGSVLTALKDFCVGTAWAAEATVALALPGFGCARRPTS